jgi:hypothetical protein
VTGSGACIRLVQTPFGPFFHPSFFLQVKFHIEESSIGKAKFALQKVWVQVFGLPSELSEFQHFWAIGSMLGSPKEVDMEFARSMAAGRIFVAVFDPNLIPATLDVEIDDFMKFSCVWRKEAHILRLWP